MKHNTKDGTLQYKNMLEKQYVEKPTLSHPLMQLM